MAFGLLAGGFAALAFWLAGSTRAMRSIALLPAAAVALAALWIPLAVLEPYSMACFARLGRLSNYARATLLARAVGAVLLVWWLAGLGLGLPGALGAVVATHALLVSLALHGLLKLAGAPRPRLGELSAMLPAGLKLHATTVAAMAIDAATLLLVFRHLSAIDAGLYQLAQQLVMFMLVVPQAAGALLHSRLSRAEADADWPLQRRIVLQVLALLGASALVVAAAAPWLTTAIGGPSFGPAADLLRWLLPTLFGPALALMLAPQWIGRGVFRINAALTVATALLLLALTEWSIRSGGLQGAVWARLIVIGVVVLAAQAGFMAWIEFNLRRHRRGLPASTIRSP
jgi:O-antigen/teichoic acid export membrane protein